MSLAGQIRGSIRETDNGSDEREKEKGSRFITLERYVEYSRSGPRAIGKIVNGMAQAMLEKRVDVSRETSGGG